MSWFAEKANIMTLTLTPNLTIRIRRAADHAWRAFSARSQRFSILCLTCYCLEILVFRYHAN
jgi:hypothetical protein